jgi:hypothetical protein
MPHGARGLDRYQEWGLVGAAAGSEGPPWGWGRRLLYAEYAPGAQLDNVREVDAGQGVDEVGLGGADGVRGLGAGAKGATRCHWDIVRGPDDGSIGWKRRPAGPVKRHAVPR